MKIAADLAPADKIEKVDKVHVLHSMQHRPAEPRATLTITECLSAFIVFVAWILLFGVGILIDTGPYRAAIVSAPTVKGWLIVVFCYLPLNLVWLCAASSVLGAFGNRANLTNDRAGRKLRDNDNPYVAAVIRGFFAYLFLISGLLLLDDQPFTNPAAAQYVRLAGFLSLLSFVISYQPRFFNTLIVWAFQRIEARESGDADKDKAGTTDTVHAVQKTVEVTATHSSRGADTAGHD